LGTRSCTKMNGCSKTRHGMERLFFSVLFRSIPFNPFRRSERRNGRSVPTSGTEDRSSVPTSGTEEWRTVHPFRPPERRTIHPVRHPDYFFILLTFTYFSPSFPFFFPSFSVLFSKFYQNLLKRTDQERKRNFSSTFPFFSVPFPFFFRTEKERKKNGKEWKRRGTKDEGYQIKNI